MKESEKRFVPQAEPASNDIIEALRGFGQKNPEEQRAAANLLGQFLAKVDTTDMDKKDRIWVESLRQKYSDPYADIGDPDRLLERFIKIFGQENE